ncbi:MULTISPECIES: hypothetical protein [unclassified Rhodosalinus]
MTTPEPARDPQLAALRRMLAQAKPEQLRRLFDDIRHAGAPDEDGRTA